MDRRVSSKHRLAEFRRTPPRADGQSPASTNGQKPRPDAQLRRKYLKDYARWLWPYRWALAAVFTLAVITAGLDMVWPLLIKLVIDLLPRGLDMSLKLHRLNMLGACIIAILLVKQAIDTWRSYRIAALNAKVIFRLRGKL